MNNYIKILQVLFIMAGYNVNNCEAMQKISCTEEQKLAVTNLYNNFLKVHEQVEKLDVENCNDIVDKKIKTELNTYFSQLAGVKDTLLNLKNNAADKIKSTVNACIDYYSKRLQDMNNYLSKTIASEKIILDTIRGVYDNKNQNEAANLNEQEWEMKKVYEKLTKMNQDLWNNDILDNDAVLKEEEKIINNNRIQREIQYRKLQILAMDVNKEISDFAKNVTKYKLL